MIEKKKTRGEGHTIAEGTKKLGEEQPAMIKSTRSTRTTRRTGLLLATVAAALVLGSGVALANQVPCQGSPDWYKDCAEGQYPENRPSEGDDVFTGSELMDGMWGRGGNDTGYGNGSDDFMSGGEGSDTFEGGEGSDYLAGGSDDDFFYGGEGDDSASFGDEGNDTLEGNAGNDELSGDEGDDWLYGNEDDDSLWGGDDFDELDGGAGDDWLSDGSSVDDSPNSFSGGPGDDTIDGSLFGPNTINGGYADVNLLDGGDTIRGGDVSDSIEGDGGSDQIFGGGGGDLVYGEEGDDILGSELFTNRRDAGRDEYYGGPGNDIIGARDGEDDALIDCGEGEKDIVEVDYRLGEWYALGEDCEIIHDGVGPSVSSYRPASGTKDRTPTIQALVEDSHPQMNIEKSDVQLYVDGRRVTAFDFEVGGILTYTPKKDLARGKKHTVKVVVKEAEGLTKTKTWSFLVK